MRYFFTLLLIIGLVFGGILLFDGSDAPKPPTIAQKTLPDYAGTEGVVRFTIDGQVNGDELHRAIRITVGRSHRIIEIIQGYENSVIKSTQLYNTQTAYDVFLRALERSGFARVRKTSVTDDRGVCPLGNRYIYEIIENGAEKQRLWSATCSGTGTSGGNSTIIQTLFKNQIPEYDKFIQGVRLNN